jgi:hypothetical protein
MVKRKTTCSGRVKSSVGTFFSRKFKVPMSALSRTVDAQSYLQQQFDKHRGKALAADNRL